MAAGRVTQVTRRVAVAGDATGRATQVTRRVAIAGDATARVTQVTRRVAMVMPLTTPGQYVEVTLID